MVKCDSAQNPRQFIMKEPGPEVRSWMGQALPGDGAYQFAVGSRTRRSPAPFTAHYYVNHRRLALHIYNAICFSGCLPMDELRLPSTIENSQRILVAGAGGGFDVYIGLPIYERLRLLGKKVYLANLSFVSLGTTNAQALTQALYAVEPTTTGQELYFPERTLAQYLSQRGENVRVYALEKLALHLSERATQTLCVRFPPCQYL
jgi:hypothetical protein